MNFIKVGKDTVAILGFLQGATVGNPLGHLIILILVLLPLHLGGLAGFLEAEFGKIDPFFGHRTGHRFDLRQCNFGKNFILLRLKIGFCLD